MFLSKCESCGFSIVKNSTCSNCGHSESCDDNADGFVEEFARRKALYRRNSNIYLCGQFLAALFAILGSAGFILRRFIRSAIRSVTRLDSRPEVTEGVFVNYELISKIGIAIAVIFVLVTIYYLFIKRSGSFLPVALNCPNCDGRLDGMKISFSQCPSCDVLLQAK